MYQEGYLVLSRRAGESVFIGNDIEVCVAEITHDKCRLAIRAPREIAVDRLEVRERKERGE